MSILVDSSTRVVVQGITGREGSFHTRRCIEYGTKVVAGVTPGRGGEKAEGVPVFNTVRQAVTETGANCGLIFVPAPFAADAVLEAKDAGLSVIVCITEGIPTQDMVMVKRQLAGSSVRLVGPNCPGVITPGQCKAGIMPGEVFAPGNVSVVSRSGTLVYEAVDQLTRLGIGQSTCVGAGGDPANFLDIGTVNDIARVVNAFQILTADPQVKAILINIFGGMARVDVIAQGVVEAHKQMRIEAPVVVRLAGTNVEEGEGILSAAGLPLIRATGLGEAAEKAVAAANR